MTMRIKKIDIRAFRGIPGLSLDLDGKSLLILGENGTGKSSIVDAIEFFFTGHVAHLEGVKGISLSKHGPHVNYKPEDVRIEITFNPGNITLTRTFKMAPEPPKQLQFYFDVVQKSAFILRRSQILTFIMSKPSNRFWIIGDIIGIRELNDVELSMKRVCDDINGKLEKLEEKLEEIKKKLSEIIGVHISTLDDILATLNEKLRKEGLPIVKSFDAIDKFITDLIRNQNLREMERIPEFSAILDKLKKITFFNDILNMADKINMNLKKFIKLDIQMRLKQAKLLEIGKEILEAMHVDICPLCGQKIDRRSLLSDISARIKQMREISEEATEIRIAVSRLEAKIRELIELLELIVERISDINALDRERRNLVDIIWKLKHIVKDFELIKVFETLIPTQDLRGTMRKLNTLRDTITAKLKQIIQDFGISEEMQRRLEIIGTIIRLANLTKEFHETYLKYKSFRQYSKIAEKIYTTFSTVKKAKVQEVYEKIQGNIEKYYSILHPDEPYGNIKLKVSMKKRASTELKMDLFNRCEEDPRALASEGHLDSLGLCIFLAFIREFNKECSLVVLDDVVTTIDARHRERLCDLLLNEFRDKQLIITTHDGIWFEQLVNAIRAYRIEGKFKHLMIVDWDVTTGPKIKPYKPRIERIKEKIANGDKWGAGNETRQYLEWLLEKICENMLVPVPFKASGRYTVGDLLPPARAHILEKIKDDQFRQKVEEAFIELEKTKILGNLLSHNNILADQVSLKEVEHFFNAVHRLHVALSCPNCGHLLKYFRELKTIRCSNLRCNKPLEIRIKG